MNVLMYPLGPDDDFPDEFCAIRQGSGEHAFYTPVGESASLMLFRAQSENAKLRKLMHVMTYCMQDEGDCDGCAMNGADMEPSVGPLFACDGLREQLSELGEDE